MKEVEELKAVSLQLTTMGYDRLYVEYSGGGDEGSVDHVIPLEEGEDATSLTYEDKTRRKRIVPNAEVVENYIYEKFLTAIGDWWNNEGGCGTFILNLETGDYTHHAGFHEQITNYDDYTGNVYQKK